MADTLMFKKGKLANLPSAKSAGTIYVTTDERAMYVDVDANTRIRLGDFIEVPTLKDLEDYQPYSTTSLYLITEGYQLIKYTGEVDLDGNAIFKTLNSTQNVSDQIDAVRRLAESNQTAIGNLQEADKTLNTSITNLGTDLEELETLVKNNETDIEKKMSDEVAARIAGDAGLQTSIDSINTAIGNIQDTYATKAELSTETTERKNADTALDGKITGLNTRVGSLETTVGNASSGLVKKVNDLNTTVGGHTTAIANLQAADETIKGDVATNADDIAKLKTDVANNTNSITTIESDLSDVSDLANANKEKITTLNNTVGGHTTAIANLQADVAKKADKTTVDALDKAYKAADAALGSRIDGAVADIADNKSAIADAELKITANTSAIGSNATAIETLKTEKANKSDLTALETAYKAADTAIKSDITDLTARVATNETDIATLKGDMATAKTDIGSNKTAIGNLQSTKADKTTVDALDKAYKAADKIHTDDIAALKTKTDTTNTNLGNLTTRVTNVETKSNANATAIGNLQTTVNTHGTDIAALKQADKDLRDYIDESFTAADNMTFKGSTNSVDELKALTPEEVNAGDTYVLIATDTKYGYNVGDLLIAHSDGDPTNWIHVQSGYTASTENKLKVTGGKLKLQNYLGGDLTIIPVTAVANSAITVAAENDAITIGMQWGSF